MYVHTITNIPPDLPAVRNSVMVALFFFPAKPIASIPAMYMTRITIITAISFLLISSLPAFS